jgi:WD40 repeat protein/tRNA A-37 threonylcarbamoyl transferase component Bud32
MATQQYEIVAEHDGAELARYTVLPGEYTIGRASASSIAIKVGPVSRTHARLVMASDGTLEIEDLGSANGTLVNGEPITARTRWRLADTVQVGDVRLLLREIPDDRALEDYAPTLSPSQAEGLLPAASPRPATATPGPVVEPHEQEVIRKHLPLEPREAQALAVEREVARGGMGAILAARESATRRTVAMKVMLRSSGAKDALRFIEEAQVTAQLEHPNIVPVHDLGVDASGQPFYTMKMVEGITLQKVLALLREGVPATVEKYPLPALLTAFQKVCDAIAFAHSRGVIHRDLKPANVMLGKFGEVLVMDWGLAKIIGRAPTDASTTEPAVVRGARDGEAADYHTMSGSVVGTPYYMSPEQARGEVETLDARSDIFTLGAILYEILVLERAFSGKTIAEVLDKVTRVDFAPPARRATKPLAHLPGGRVPDSLDAIVRKAMALRREDRYANVEALQADLAAYQTGFATSAEHAGTWKQFKLFVARNRRVATAIAGGLAALAMASALFTWRVFEEKKRAEAGEAAAQREARIAALSAEAAQLVNLAQTNPEDALMRAMLAVEKSRTLLGRVTPAVQYGLTAALERQRILRVASGTVGAARRILWSEASGHLVKFGERNQVEILDRDTRPVARCGELGSGQPRCAAISDDGAVVAMSGDGPKLAAWLRDPGQPDVTKSWEAHQQAVRALAFVPGSRRLVSLSAAGEVKEWLPDGSKAVGTWQIAVADSQIDLAAFSGTARTLVFTPPGALSTEAFVVRLGEPSQAAAVALHGHATRITAVAASHDGTRVATADSDGLVRIWSSDGRLIGGPFSVQRGAVRGLAFSPEDDLLAVVGVERSAAVFSLNGLLMHGPFEAETEGSEGLAMSSDGVLWVGDGRRYDLLGLESELALLVGAGVEDAVVAPDGKKCAALDVNGRLTIWEWPSRHLVARVQVLTGRGRHLEASADGAWLACATQTGREVYFVDWLGRQTASPFRLGDESVQAIESFPATGWLAVGTNRGRVIFHHPAGAGPDEVVELAPQQIKQDAIVTLAATPQGLLARARWNDDTQQGCLVSFDNLRRVQRRQPVRLARWFASAFWRFALLGSEPRALMLAGQNAVMLVPDAQGTFVERALAVSAPQQMKAIAALDAESFAAGTDDGALRLFSLQAEALTPWLRRDLGTVRAIVPFPDGQRFLTAGGDGRVRIWDHGVESWMRSAARRLGDSARDPAFGREIDGALAPLLARYPASPRVRPASSATTAATGRVEAGQAAPEGFKPISGTPLAWPVPAGWAEVSQDKLALLNRLMQTLFAKRRAGEFDVVAGLLPQGTELRQALADASTPGFQVLRLNSVSTPEEIEQISREAISLLRGAIMSGQMAQVIAGAQLLDPGSELTTGYWDEELQTLAWRMDQKNADGQRALFRVLVVPTREKHYFLAMRAGGTKIEEAETAAREIITRLQVAPELRVDDAFRGQLRRVAEAAQARSALKQRTEQFFRDRDAICRLIDANKPDEAEPLVAPVLALAAELEKLDTANPGKWLLESAKARGEFTWRFVGKGRHATARAIIEPGIAEAEGVLRKTGSTDAKAILATVLLRAAVSLRNLKEFDLANATYERGMAQAEAVQAAGYNAMLAERMMEAGNEWAYMLRDQKRLEAAAAIYPRILAAHRLLRENALRDNGTLRGFFDDAHLVPEVAFILGQFDEARAQLRAQLDFLTTLKERPGLDAGVMTVIARYCGRVQNLVERDPKAALHPRKELAQLALFWLEKAKSFGALNAELEGWRVRADSIAHGRFRGCDLPRPAAATARQIDLSEHYTCGLDEQGIATDPKFTFAMLPDGLVKLGGIEWDLRGMVQVGSRSMKPERTAPLKIEGIRIGQRLGKLHVLHAANWNEKEPVEIGSYVLRYADGQTASLPIFYGCDLRDWSVSVDPGQLTPDAPVVWTGPGGSAGLRLFHRAYVNPRPEAEVATLDFISANRQAAPFVVAITVE